MLTAVAAAVALAANSTLYSDDAPPLRFRGDRTLVVEFIQPPLIDFRCGDITISGDQKRAGCTHGLTISVPNPCLFADKEIYARILCHELGHVNGWPATHGD